MKKPAKFFYIQVSARKQLIIAALIGIVSFAIYLSTASKFPTTYGDSAEMIAAAFTKGIPHPPSYPLYILLGYIVTHISLGTIAYRLNAFSGLLHALTLVFVYTGILEICKSIPLKKELPHMEDIAILAATTGALCLGFSFLFFLYSGIAEVFPLNDFFIALSLYLILLYRNRLITERQVTIILYALAVCIGLMLSNQQTSILILPPVFLFLLTIQFGNKPTRAILHDIGSIIIGIAAFILAYMYLPVMASSGSPISWRNPTSIPAIINTILRSDYASTKGSSTSAYITGTPLQAGFTEIFHYIYLIATHFLWLVPFALIGLIGIILFEKEKSRIHFLAKYDISIFLILSLLFSGFFLASYTAIPWNEAGTASLFTDIGTHIRLYLQSEIYIGVCIGLGIYFTLYYLFIKKNLHIPYLICICFILVISLFLADISGANVSANSAEQNLTATMLKSLPRNAILISFTDASYYPFLYEKYIEHIRPDVILVSTSAEEYRNSILAEDPTLFKTHATSNALILTDIIARNITTQKIFLAFPTLTDITSIGLAGNPYYIVPYGYLLEVTTDPRQYTTVDFNTSQAVAKPITDIVRQILSDSRDNTKLAIPETYATMEALEAYSLFNDGYKNEATILIRAAKQLQTAPLTPVSETATYISIHTPLAVQIYTYEQYMQAAIQVYNEKKYQQAESYFVSAYILSPNNVLPLTYLLNCYKATGNITAYNAVSQELG